MIANGHAWSSIQNYTLSEIGVFLHVIITKEAENKTEEMSRLWYGSNLSQEGFQKTMKRLEKSAGIKYIPIEKSPKEVQNDWKRLKAFMTGKK